MRKPYTLILACLLGLLAGSCNNNDDEFEYEHEDYLDQIADISKARQQGSGMFREDIDYFYDKYGSVLLYEFPDGMLHYNGFTSSFKKRYYTPAQEECISGVLTLFKNFINHFPERLRNEILPRQILIVDTIATEEHPDKMMWSDLEGLEKIIIGGAGTESSRFLMADSKARPYDKLGAQGMFRKGLCVPWILDFFQDRILPYPEFYYNDYSLVPKDITVINSRNAKEYGIIGITWLYNKDRDKFIEKDLADFLTKLFELGDVEFKKKYFSSFNDPKGNVKKKYDLFMTTFKDTYGIDLERLISEESLLKQDNDK